MARQTWVNAAVGEMSAWQTPPKNLFIDTRQVDVWRVDLDRLSTHLDHYYQTLSVDEAARSQRFHFVRDRDQFVIARGVLRTILGLYLMVQPERLTFNYSMYGKPSLGGEWQGCGLNFNISHSHGLALVAIMRGAPVGVDVEWMRADLADEQIARRFFSSYEVEALQAQPQPDRTEAFFNCWTRKEAYIKGRGEGLSLPLNQFDVTLSLGQPACLIATRPDPYEKELWSLFHLEPGPGYVGALAVAAHSLHLRQWDWNQRVQ